MTALLDAVAAAGERLIAASDGRIAFDPRRAMSRADDLDLVPPGEWSPNRHCRLIPCQDEWIAVSLARDVDRELIPAWTGAAFEDDPWDAIAASAKSRPATAMVADGVALHLPVARIGETSPIEAPDLYVGARKNGMVLDLSALWAGPYCGALLAEAGYEVVKVESSARPDPTPVHTPRLDRRLNGRKRRQTIAFEPGVLIAMVAKARVLITAGRPHALARLGLSEAEVFAANPDLLWVAITAHGWRGDAAMRVGFGDDCAAAGGLVAWDGDRPNFMGDALADPLTGIVAATFAFEALAAGKCGVIDLALAQTAAHFARIVA